MLDELRAQADELSETWREVYNLPPNDPRYLDADDEMMICDLLTRMLLEERRRSPEDRERDRIERLAQDPEAAAAMLARKRDFLADQRHQGTIRRVLGLTRGGPIPRTIRVGRAVFTGE